MGRAGIGGGSVTEKSTGGRESGGSVESQEQKDKYGLLGLLKVTHSFLVFYSLHSLNAHMRCRRPPLIL